MATAKKGSGNVGSEAVTAASDRTVYTFTVPETCRVWDSDPETIGLVELTVDDERRASKRARANNTSVAYELAKESLVASDGKAVTWKSNQKELVLEGSSPKVRALILEGFQHLHVPEEKGEKGAFLSSMSAQG